MSSDWTRSETISPPDEITLKWKTENGEEKEVDLQSTTKSASTSNYQTFIYVNAEGKEQAQDIMVSKIDEKITTIASVNGSYVTERLKYGLSLPPGDALTRSESTYEYVATTEGMVKIRETTTDYISMMQFAGGLAVANYSFLTKNGNTTTRIWHDPSLDLIPSQTTEIVYETIKTFSGREMTRQSTSRWISRGLTQEWQQAFGGIAKARLFTTAEKLQAGIESMLSFVFEGTEVQISIGRAPVAEKPSDQELAASDVLNGNDTDIAESDLWSGRSPTDVFGNDLGWPAFVPGGANGDWQKYAKDSNGDGEPDWQDYVPQSYEAWEPDSDNDGTPDWVENNTDPPWAPYVPDDDGDGIPDWQNYVDDNNGDGQPDWQDYTPIGSEFSTADKEYNGTSFTVDGERSINGIAVYKDGTYNPSDLTVTATYEMPFAPDDRYEYVKSIPKLLSGGATAAAIKFGQTEVALDFGHAFGHNIVTGWNEIPTLDMSTVYVRFAGIEGAFYTDSVSYAWGPEGMVVSSDLMLIGVCGWYGSVQPTSSWLRVPIPVSSLPQVGSAQTSTAAKANTIAIPNGFDIRNPGPTLALLPNTGTDTFAVWRNNQPLVSPALQFDEFKIRTGPRLKVKEYPYALTLSPETAVMASGPLAELQELTALQLPAAVISLQGLAPAVVGGASVAVPAASVAMGALVPFVGTATVVVVPPAAAIQVTALLPELIGRPRLEVAAPTAAMQLSALPPVVLTGTFLEVPAAAVSLAGLAPTVDTYGDGDGATPGAADLYGATQDWQAETWAA